MTISRHQICHASFTSTTTNTANLKSLEINSKLQNKSGNTVLRSQEADFHSLQMHGQSDHLRGLIERFNHTNA